MDPIETGECWHAISQRIEPPDEQGWQRESCGTCGRTLRWTHHAITTTEDPHLRRDPS